ncbi:MAG: rhodanese-like domain-containing protein [Rhodospirillaceae bacterium]|jgi:rhodanese-related sulfurtransferase|nr:rhodanese-like domain-containing protein [Rhodospirillaceae bacterium]MBT4045469.1 rhodanese-like domain-containing protein [Rhodospirillaceae bacterium]MBT4688362.1 rhodanese-like domain-containing protein [Rhodospirillaceae bacterium]MBT5083613.1 rhodanese-like domain-containing protein [Rhodospirillaceae bacterium]MBT5525663.1 rhodanese-like domain-containing protein [Rhodospirillaceae bacterium]
MLKRGFKVLLAEANALIETVSVQDLAFALDDEETLLVDVRETVERENDGLIPGSIHAPRGMLEFQADPEFPGHNAELNPEYRLILYCGTGGRSALAAKTLLDMGFDNVASLAGGYAAWSAARDK